MRAILSAVAVAAVWVAGSSDARAQCGGDSGSVDSSSSTNSSSDSSDSEPACEEVSPVVGHAICGRFGSWDARRRPAVRVIAGASMLRIPVGSMAFAGDAGHSDVPMSYAVTGERAAAATGGAFDLQVAASVGPHLYVGLEGSVGGLDSGPMSASASTADLGVTTESLVYLAGAAIAGAAVSLGANQIRGELGVGIRAVGLTVETRHADCVLGDTRYDTALLLRPRLAAQRWITPWVSVGASVGSNLARRGETSVGLFVGGHLRAFDAR
jgi:hypothetical protein